MTHRHTAALAFAALLLLGVFPRTARAQGLLEGELSLRGRAHPDLRVAAAGPTAPSLDFDLLGEPPKRAVPREDPSLEKRRRYLDLHQGLGLGLFIVKGISDAHGGTVGVDSTLGVGSTFFLEVPRVAR